MPLDTGFINVAFIEYKGEDYYVRHTLRGIDVDFYLMSDRIPSAADRKAVLSAYRTRVKLANMLLENETRKQKYDEKLGITEEFKEYMGKIEEKPPETKTEKPRTEENRPIGIDNQGTPSPMVAHSLYEKRQRKYMRDYDRNGVGFVYTWKDKPNDNGYYFACDNCGMDSYPSHDTPQLASEELTRHLLSCTGTFSATSVHART